MSPERPSRLGESPLIRFTGMLGGVYRYVDFPGAEPQLVDVTYEEGYAVARFRDMEPEDAEVTLLVSDMAGEFLPAKEA